MKHTIVALLLVASGTTFFPMCCQQLPYFDIDIRTLRKDLMCAATSLQEERDPERIAATLNELCLRLVVSRSAFFDVMTKALPEGRRKLLNEYKQALSEDGPQDLPELLRPLITTALTVKTADDKLPRLLAFSVNSTATYFLQQSGRSVALLKDLLAVGAKSAYIDYYNQYGIQSQVVYLLEDAIIFNDRPLATLLLNKEGQKQLREVDMGRHNDVRPYRPWRPLFFALSSAARDHRYGFGMMNLLLRHGLCVNQRDFDGSSFLPHFLKVAGGQSGQIKRKKPLYELKKILDAKPDAQQLWEARAMALEHNGKRWETVRDMVDEALDDKHKAVTKFLNATRRASIETNMSDDTFIMAQNIMDQSLIHHIASFVTGVPLPARQTSTDTNGEKDDINNSKRQKL